VCGACGRARAVDEWSPRLDSRRAWWEGAQVVDGLLSRAGCAARVTATPSGWLVRSATGRASLAETLSALWAVVGPLPGGAPLPVEPAAGTVAAAVCSSYRRHLGQTRTGGTA